MFRHFRNRVSNFLRIAKRNYYTDMILENKFKPKLMWKCLKELLSEKSKASPKGQLIDGHFITTFLSMAFNKYFTSIRLDLASKLAPTPLTHHLTLPS